MQASAGVPAAGPLTVTLCTRPSEPKMTFAVEASCPDTQERAAPKVGASAACTAPALGSVGTLGVPSAGGSGPQAADGLGAVAVSFWGDGGLAGLGGVALFIRFDSVDLPCAIRPGSVSAGGSCSNRTVGSDPAGGCAGA